MHRGHTCVIPFRVSSSIRLMMYGFFRNFSLKCFTVTGKVAEYRQIWRSAGRKEMSCSIIG